MEFKGTKGIWYVEESEIKPMIDFCKKITYVSTNSNFCALILGDSNEEVKANALLISKAPEMLEAMQEFVDRVDKGEVRSNRTYNKFKQIIKKATEL